MQYDLGAKSEGRMITVGVVVHDGSGHVIYLLKKVHKSYASKPTLFFFSICSFSFFHKLDPTSSNKVRPCQLFF